MEKYELFLLIYFHGSVFYLLVFVLIGTLLDFIYYTLQKRKGDVIKTEGIKVNGKISEHSAKKFHYYVVYEYVFEEKRYTQRQSIYKLKAKDLVEEKSVEICVLPREPEKSLLSGVDTYFASYYLLAIGLLFVLFFLAITILQFLSVFFI